MCKNGVYITPFVFVSVKKNTRLSLLFKFLEIIQSFKDGLYLVDGLLPTVAGNDADRNWIL